MEIIIGKISLCSEQSLIEISIPSSFNVKKKIVMNKKDTHKQTIIISHAPFSLSYASNTHAHYNKVKKKNNFNENKNKTHRVNRRAILLGQHAHISNWNVHQ